MSVESAAARYLVDSYLDWARGEGFEAQTGDTANALTMAARPWTRLGEHIGGGFAHLNGRGDFLALHVIELPPGTATRSTSHLFNEIYFALSGGGELRMGAGGARVFPWRRNSLFAPALNARFALVNTSEGEPARLARVTNLPFQMNFFREEKFLFDNAFPRAEARAAVIYDVLAAYAPARPSRGVDCSGGDLDLGAGMLRAHVGEIGAATFARARRHGPGAHVFPLGEAGYSLVFDEAARNFERFDWRPGLVIAPGDDKFIQHFNTGAAPARYLVIGVGNKSRPLLARKEARLAKADASFEEGGSLLDYAQQPPDIRAAFEAELARKNISSRMEARS